MADYIELEYIETTGTQYIDTGFIANQDTRLIMDFQFLGSSNKWIFGSRSSSGLNSYGLIVELNVNSFRSDYNTEEVYVSNSNHLNDRHIIDKYKNKTYIDNTMFGESTYSSFTCPSTLALFTLHKNDSSYDLGISRLKFYSCKIYNNNSLTRDFIPVKRKLDNEICLYDKVSNTFFTNQGSGNFIAGPEIIVPDILFSNINTISNTIDNLTSLTNSILGLNVNPEEIIVDYDTTLDVRTSPANQPKVDENIEYVMVLGWKTDWIRRALLKFNFEEYQFNINKIQKVELYMYYYYNDIPENQDEHFIRNVIKDWNNETIFDSAYNTTNTYIDYTYKVGNLASINTSNYGYGWRKCDVTNLVLQWLNKTIPNYGLIVDCNNNGNWSAIRYYSKEADNDYKPKLVFTYNN